MTLRFQFNSEHASVPSHLFRVSFSSALTIHVAQHSPRTSRHGVSKNIPGAVQRWKGQLEGLRLYSFYQDAVGNDGEIN